MGKKRTFKAGDEVYDISEAEVEEFLKDVPSAKEVKSFIVDKDTFDIPLDEIEEFTTAVPTAKPLFEEEPTQSQEIPSITLDSAEVADGTADAPEWTGDAGKIPTLTKQTMDVFMKHAGELPDKIKYDARNSQIYINTFAKKTGTSPMEMRKVYNDFIQNEAKLKELKNYYDQHPDDVDNLYKIAELHNAIGQHDLALEAYQALEGKLRKIGEAEALDPNNPNQRPDYVDQRVMPAIAGMAYTEGLRGNMAEAQRLQAITGYKGQEFSSVGEGDPLQVGNEMTYDEQGRKVAVGSPTPESEYLNGIAQAIENFTLFGPASKMTEHGLDKVAKNLPSAFNPYGLPSEKVKGTIGAFTGAVETLMGVAGMTTPAGALFAMPLVQAQNIAPKQSEWIMPIGKVLREYYRQQGEEMPETMENVTVLADLALLGFLTHAGTEGFKDIKTEADFKKVFDKLPPEAIEQLAKVGEKRIEDAGGDPQVYGEQMAARIEEIKPQVEEIKLQAETPEVEPYNPPPHPESLRTVEEGSSIVMNGEEGILERGDDGTWYHTTDNKSTQIKVEDKFNPTETLKELGIEVLAEITPEQVAKATADAEQVGRVTMNGKEYFVSLDRVGNENPTGDFVLEVKPDGTMINRFDSHPDPTFAKERKQKVINTFLESKGLPTRRLTAEVKAKPVEEVVEAPTQEIEPSTSEITPIENEKVNQEGREKGLLEPTPQEILPANEPVSPAVEVETVKGEVQEIPTEVKSLVETSVEEYRQANPARQKEMVDIVKDQLEKNDNAEKSIGMGLDPIKVEAGKEFLKAVDIKVEEPVILTSKEKALKAVDDLEAFLMDLPGVKDTTGAERMGAPFSMEEAVKFFTKKLRESINEGYIVKDAIERAIGKAKRKYSDMFENISEEDLRARARKQYEDQGVSLDKPIEQQFGASHASVAEVREAMGLGDFERVSEYEQRDVKTVMTKGKELAGKIDVQELATDVNNGRPISAEEQAALVYEETRVNNEFEAKETEINRLIAKGAMNEADQAIIALQEIKHRQNNILSALDKAGSEMGLAFRMRQVMNKRDYSVVGLERRWSKANGGKPVPKEVTREFEQKVKELKEENELLQKTIEAKDRQIQEQALLDIEESAKRAKQTPDQRVKAAKKARKQELAQKFRGVFNDATNIAKAMVDKEFYEYARLVFEDAVGDFKEFSKRMIGDLGKNVEPHLQEIFDKASKKEYEKAYQDENGIHIDRDLLVDIIESIERDPKTGTKSAKEFMDKVEEAVKVDLPDVERRQIQDAVSGYGKQSNKTLPQLQQDLNQVKRDLQLVSGLDDAKAKKGVLRTGSPPKPPTDYQRGLQKQIREELKDQPQSQEELAKKWATALDRTKSALRNAITDNTKRIEDIKNGTAVPKTPKDKLKLDSEAEQLQEMNNDLKKELKELEGKKKLTDQQLLDLTIKAVERVAEKYELRTQEIRKTGTYTKDTPRILSSPELDIARLDRDAKKAEYEQALKDNNLDELEYASRQLSASQKRVANLENKIKANDISFAAKALNRIDYNNNPELAASIYQEKVLKDTIKKMREEQGLVEAREREMWAKRKEKQIKDIQHRIKTKDFGKKVPKEKILDIEEARIQRRLDRAKFDLDVKIEASRLQNMGTTEKLRDHLNSLINLPKGLMASFDISAPLRQGAILFARHPIYGLKNSREMIKDWFSKEHAEAWHEDLIRSDEYIRAKNAGLFISEPMARLVAAEEQFQTKYLNKVPGFSASNRAYSGFLNRMRMDVFNQFYDGLIQDRFTGKALQNELNSMAHIINNFSGRGKLGKGGELASPLLNSLFFAPRFVTSRVNTLANALSGYWLEGRWWGKQKMGTRARIEAYKSLGAYVATGTAILKMADAAGLDVEIDPRSSDFGKIKIGDLRYDIWAGHQQIIVLLSRIANQASIDLRTGKVKPFDEDTNTWTTVKNFGRSKASPFVGYGIDAMTGVNSQYEKFEWDKEAWKISLPLLLQDPVMRLIYDDYVSMYREGEAGVGTFAASATGVGVNWIKPHEDVVNAKLTPKSDKLMLNKMYTPQRTKDQEVYVKGKPYHISDEQLKRIQKIRAKEAGKLINKDYSDLRKLSEEEYASEVNSYYNKGLKEAYDKVLPRGWSEDNK